MLLVGCSAMDSTEPPVSHSWSMSAPSQGFSTAGTKHCPCNSPSCWGLSCCEVLSPGASAAASSSLGCPGSFISSRELGSLVKDGPVQQMQTHILFARCRGGERSGDQLKWAQAWSFPVNRGVQCWR